MCGAPQLCQADEKASQCIRVGCWLPNDHVFLQVEKREKGAIALPDAEPPRKRQRAALSY
eukprot:11541407-Prorocentrum_lima.AAC.1